MKKILYLTVATTLMVSCGKSDVEFDASGTFEAVETIVPAEANGVLKAFDVREGQQLKAGEIVGYIDSTQIYLKQKQLEAQIGAVLSKKPNEAAQLAALREQLQHAMHEQSRMERLFKADAATGKQLDDAIAQVDIIEKKIEAQESSLNITSSSLQASTSPLSVQIAQLQDQLEKHRIKNPVSGTVLSTYAEAKEMANVGKPLYKVADLSSIILRAYITGNQFAQIKMGQQVKVMVDDGNGGYKSYPGVVEWISDKAEFTPKTIQTKEERANLVYAVKIRVENDGYLKIGMYGEVMINNKEDER